MTLKHLFQLTLTKTQLNLKAEAKKSYLSYLWWILEPALFVGVFYIVFGVFFAGGTPDFIAFLLCGQIPFLWFARTVGNSTSAIENGRGLMQQIKIPKIFFPLVTIMQDFVKSICVFLLFFTFMWSYGYEPSTAWLALPFIIFTQFCFIAALAVFVSMIVPFVPDLKFLIATGIQLTMFASGIFYDYKVFVLEKHQNIFLLNPMANLIEQYRAVLMHGLLPDVLSLVWIFMSSLLFLLCCIYVLAKIDTDYPRILAQ